ncbi:tol-pal system YbgF family protein [Myxococcus sp. RHSTA-1-4]|uniref:tetratricopeptide repeat protein n=1 Tax=Myxococcus sp. RHSTA-1-4 TaxID=2874601 RepID=UPI001CBC7F7D|nr:tetratricopeptide repeat protein [Myxococcus sp. RHSTA-1-4]MBZ4417785.1 tetratricopeptide repeat protein [Myxococcus sp. RHSTA-1-4]
MRSELRRWLVTCVVLACGLASAEPLVGPGVGNADALVAEGTRLYNKRRYADASKQFLKATRANPSLLQAYLGLARSRMGAKEVHGACAAYRAYLRSAPDIQDRPKAQRELELCERKLKAARRKKKNKVPPDLTARHVELKAGFFAALADGKLVGPDSAGEMLTTLVSEGYLGTDLGEMGVRLSAACRIATEELHRRALGGEALPAERLAEARKLFELASDAGEPSAGASAQAPFLEGLAMLQKGDSARAQALFAEAARAAPDRTEYRLWRAAALQRAGDLGGALAVMEADLPGDPRTDVLRAAVANQKSPEAGARELERILFQRYPAAR